MRADAGRCDLVYRAFLESLTLSPAHADHLIKARGLSPETITANLYASMPTAREALTVCDRLAREFDLEGVPGFYRRSSTGTAVGCVRDASGAETARHWVFNAWPCPGIILTVRDVVGHIVGLKVRRFSYEGKDKYVWVTSAGKPGGASARATVHYARPDLARQRGSAIITEGVLKADIVSEQMQCAVVGLPGADTFRLDFGRTLRASIPELQSIFVAYDADYRTNKHVRAALLRLIGTLEGVGLAVSVLKWNPTQGKGFDDLLLTESGVKA